MPKKDEPAAEPIPCDFTHDLRSVYYWIKSGDWPAPGQLKHQAPKVKMVAQLVIQVLQTAERAQAMRMEMIVRAIGSM